MAGEESKFKAFLKKAADDVKRVGAEMKDEAKKLVGDEAERKRLTDGLKGVARAAADSVENVMAPAVKKAEKQVKAFTGTTPGMNPELYELSKSARVVVNRPSKYAHLAPDPTPPTRHADTAPQLNSDTLNELKPDTLEQMHGDTMSEQLRPDTLAEAEAEAQAEGEPNPEPDATPARPVKRKAEKPGSLLSADTPTLPTLKKVGSKSVKKPGGH